MERLLRVDRGTQNYESSLGNRQGVGRSRDELTRNLSENLTNTKGHTDETHDDFTLTWSGRVGRSGPQSELS